MVAYLAILLKKFDCHINAEVCNTLHAVKYLHKYISKGGDRAEVEVVGSLADAGLNGLDEIQQYLDGRYICTSEAVYRCFSFQLHHNSPVVDRLVVHLEGDHTVMFDEHANLPDVVEEARDTRLTKWLEYNADNENGRAYTYVEFPEHFVWKGAWHPRQTGNCIGRLYFVAPRSGEKYYLRVLLHHVRGATSWEEIRSINGHV